MGEGLKRAAKAARATQKKSPAIKECPDCEGEELLDPMGYAPSYGARRKDCKLCKRCSGTGLVTE